jgi:Ser/Thr protein kinase RdoA (MazF antagonist)
MEVIPEKSQELIAALGAYHQAIAALTNDEFAYLEMLLRASADVARFLREHRDAILTSGLTPPPAAESEKQETQGEQPGTEVFEDSKS